MKLIIRLLLISSFSVLFANSSGVPKSIVGGDYADEGQFTYSVSLQYNYRHVCGGTIIADQYILTAAHCVIDRKGKFRQLHYDAVMGVEDLIAKDFLAIRIPTKKIYVPKIYDSQFTSSGYRVGDLAVMKLEYGMQLDSRSQLSKLNLPTNVNEDYTGRTAIIAGYGWNKVDENEKGTSDYKLRYAELNFASYDSCKPRAKSLLCGHVKQRDSKKPEGVCTGDSGAAVALDNIVIAVVSNSPEQCREDKKPSIYVKVVDFLSFINNAKNDYKDSTMRLAVWKWNENTSKGVIVEQ